MSSLFPAVFKALAHLPRGAGSITGFGLPLRESIEQGQWKQAEEQIVRVGRVLENAGEAIASASAALERATGR